MLNNKIDYQNYIKVFISFIIIDMCGIFGCICNDERQKLKDRSYYINLSKRIRHRGPDWSGIYYNNENNVDADNVSDIISLFGIGEHGVYFNNKCWD